MANDTYEADLLAKASKEKADQTLFERAQEADDQNLAEDQALDDVLVEDTNMDANDDHLIEDVEPERQIIEYIEQPEPEHPDERSLEDVEYQGES